MVSNNRRRLKKACEPPVLYSFLIWIKIMCSGCFGRMVQFKRPYCLPEARMNRPTDLTRISIGREGRPAAVAKLDLSMGNLTLQPAARQQQTQLFAWELPGQEEEGDMFEGRFYVGSKVLTEVEMRSPVEESKGRFYVGSKASRKIPARSKSGDERIAQMGSDGERANQGAAATPIDAQGEPGSEPIDIASVPCSSKLEATTPKKKSPSPAREMLLREGGMRDFEAMGGSKKVETAMNSSPELEKPKELTRKSSSKLRRSLTDHDFAELRGCIDLGFVFTQDDIPDLCDTLPALEVCYAITQKLQDPQASSIISPPSANCDDSGSPSPGSSLPSPISSWKVASPGDEPQQVKARLRHWAQAVACTVRQSC